MADFHVPLTFPNISFLRRDETEEDAARSVLEESLAGSRPTSLEYWDRDAAHTLNDSGESKIIIGCQDGTVYVLSRSHSFPSIDPLPPHIHEPSKPPPISRQSKSSHSNSGSPSPISASLVLSPTFNVTAKPRVVSGVTTEQVEAPKNYVDFEDETDKLKDILKGRAPKDRRSISDTHSDKASKPAVPSPIEPVPVSKRKNRLSRSLLSAANSRAPTPSSFSIPSSPQEASTASSDLRVWSLQYHIIPPPPHAGSATRAIQLLNDNRFFAALQENGAISLYSYDDGSCAAFTRIEENPNVAKDISTRQEGWLWFNLSVVYIEGSTVLIAMAENSNNTTLPSSDIERAHGTSHFATIEIIPTPSSIQLQVSRQWTVDGPTKAASLYEEPDGTIILFNIDHNGHLMGEELKLRPLPITSHHSPPLSNNSNTHQYGAHLPIPNPFKSLMSRSTERLVLNEAEPESRLEDSKVWMPVTRDLGAFSVGTTFLGLRISPASVEGKNLGVAWTNEDLILFEATTQTLSVSFRSPVSAVEDIAWLDRLTYMISFEHHVEIYRLIYVNADNEQIDPNYNDADSRMRPELVHTISIGCHEAIQFSQASLILTKFSKDIPEVISYSLREKALESSEDISSILWQFNPAIRKSPVITITSMLPLDLEHIIQGYSDGFLRQFSLAQMARKSEKSSSLTSSSVKTSNQPLGGSVVGLHVVQNYRTRDRFIVGGGDDGSIAFWSFSTFELVARWTIFVTPLVKVLQFEAERTGPLRGCALCIAEDGSIAVIVIDDLHFLYLIPGSNSPLERVCLGENNLLLVYSDHRVRLWDAQTKELWRSMGEDKADELLAQGEWSELTLQTDACVPKLYWTSITDSTHSPDTDSSLNLNLEKFLIDAISITKSISTSKDEVREILRTLDRLRLILSTLLIPGLNSDVDSICYGKLGAYPSSTILGLASIGGTTLYERSDPREVWCWSSTATASRALAIIAVLRAMSLFEELTEGANTVISFFITSLGLSVGPRFQPPSIEFLGRLWFEASNEFRNSIRLFFDATITNLSDEESISIAEKWQHHVPSLQPDAEKETLNAALALFICGCIAAEKYSLLSTNALSDISKSISLYLHDEKSIYRVLAIDLCSRGFNVWQHYIDVKEILRSLFDLATNVRKDSISIQNVGSQARLAVLTIASNNMPLFMGTLCLDVLTPPTMEHRRSVLQILAFLIRKRPFILQPNLPRLMEAVVKSLDPNSTSDRDLVLDTATEIIGYVVKTYPTVDFHMATQRLAVGTNEGAVIMYDLKTAIRLYVLEGHKKPITALSFSPDGRRLVTMSLKESVVLAWKVGSSFASFFNPGAPPRQGHGGSQPFKTLNFNIGTEAEMSTAQTLDLVKVEWVADRSVKVKIRQSVLTFST